MILVGGYNKYRQLITESEGTEVYPPQILDINTNIRSFSTYASHSVKIDEEGQAFVIGNDLKFRIGTPDRKIYTEFTKLTFDDLDERFISAYCGYKFTVYITETYKLILCSELDVQRTPRIYEFNTRPLSLFGGSETCAIIDEQGDVYVINPASIFSKITKKTPKMGIQKISPSIHLPTPAIMVACGTKTLITLTKKNLLYSNIFDKNGAISSCELLLFPTQSKSSQIISITGTSDTFFALDSDGLTYGFTTNLKQNRLALANSFNNGDIKKHFVLIESLLDYKIDSIYVGEDHLLFITNDKEVFSYGSNKKKQLLMNDFKKNFSQNPLKVDLNGDGNYATSAIAGKALSVVFINVKPKHSPNQEKCLFMKIPIQKKASLKNFRPKIKVLPQCKPVRRSSFNSSSTPSINPSENEMQPYRSPRLSNPTKPKKNYVPVLKPARTNSDSSDSSDKPSKPSKKAKHSVRKWSSSNDDDDKELSQSDSDGELSQSEKEDSKSTEKEDSKSTEKEDSKSTEKEDSKSIEKEDSKSIEKDDSKSIEKEDSKSTEKDDSKSIEKDDSKPIEKEDSKSVNDDDDDDISNSTNDDDESTKSEGELNSPDEVHIEEVNKSIADELERVKKENEILKKILRRKVNEQEDKMFIDQNDFKNIELISYFSQNRNSNVSKVKNSTTRTAYYTMKSFKKEDFKEFKKFYRHFNIQSTIHHPCIVKFFGFANTMEGITYPSLLVEYLPFSLRELMNDHQKEKLLTSTQKVEIIIDIAFGMKFLHENQHIVHRNLKPENILITKKYHAKIGDLAWADEIIDEADFALSQKLEGWSTYTAPEIIKGLDYHEKVDQFAFGKLVYFILNDGVDSPFSYLELERGVTFKKLPTFNELAVDLIEKCCDYSPGSRPLFSEVIELIENGNFALLPNVDENKVKERLMKLKLLEEIET